MPGLVGKWDILYVVILLSFESIILDIAILKSYWTTFYCKSSLIYVAVHML